jgi:hypothetical protein
VLGDLGNFDLEESLDEVRVGAGEDDLDLAAGVADVEDHAADAVAGLELLARDLLGAGHEGLARSMVTTRRRPRSAGRCR